MRTHSRTNRDARIVVTGNIPNTDEVPTWEVELITEALTSKDEPIDRLGSDPNKGGPHAPAHP